MSGREADSTKRPLDRDEVSQPIKCVTTLVCGCRLAPEAAGLEHHLRGSHETNSFCCHYYGLGDRTGNGAGNVREQSGRQAR